MTKIQFFSSYINSLLNREKYMLLKKKLKTANKACKVVLDAIVIPLVGGEMNDFCL